MWTVLQNLKINNIARVSISFIYCFSFRLYSYGGEDTWPIEKSSEIKLDLSYLRLSRVYNDIAVARNYTPNLTIFYISICIYKIVHTFILNSARSARRLTTRIPAHYDKSFHDPAIDLAVSADGSCEDDIVRQ